MQKTKFETSSDKLSKKMNRLTEDWVHDDDLHPSQVKDLEAFIQHLRDDGKAPRTINTYAGVLVDFAKELGKPFKDATAEEVKQYMRNIDNNTDSVNSYNNTMSKIKMLYRWLYDMDKDNYPEQVEDLKHRKTRKRLPVDSFLSKKQIKKFIGATDNLRDRALLMTLWDSGGRISEILDLRIKNVDFDKYGATILIRGGKTGDRRVRLIEAAPDLQLWVNHHPYNDNPEAPLWQSSQADEPDGIALNTVYGIFKKAKKRAGIKKRVTPHLLRHMRITEHASILTEQELKVRYGWTPDSNMASVYVHLTGEDVDKKLLEKHGLLDREEEDEEEEVVNICPRCGKHNSNLDKFCGRCGMALSVEAAQEAEGRTKQAGIAIDELMQQPEARDRILDTLRDILKETGGQTL